MKRSITGNKNDLNASVFRRGSITLAYGVLCLLTLLFLAACNEFEKPAAEPFFAQAIPPKKQEFRWSNGKLPKSFDPAAAAAAPETDVVRAIFEGLTETDPATLEEVPAVAETWSATSDFKVWTFNLRKDAKWTNGKPVTAEDFVRSWKRLIAKGNKTAYRNLLNNIQGVPVDSASSEMPVTDADGLLLNAAPTPGLPVLPSQQLVSPDTNSNADSGRAPGDSNSNSQRQKQDIKNSESADLGISAEGDLVLKVTLVQPDKDFPKLVANPIFRPVYGEGEGLLEKQLNASIVANGPFKVASVDAAGIVLERSESYWNRDAVKLERVHFVPMESAEKALAAYRSGALDAVTNADFAPLVLKLLTPYDDFRRTTHSALNFYDINYTRAPFSDRRVRQALSNAIEREKLTEGEMEGVTRPALSFLPFGNKTKNKLSQDKEKAKELLDDAGFPDGRSFPVIRLLVNRNDAQQRIARSVARMWKQNLNLETEVIVMEPAEVEAARKAGEFDIVRRGIVLPTSDEAANFMAIFDSAKDSKHVLPAPAKSSLERPSADQAGKEDPTHGEVRRPSSDLRLILNEEDALYELLAIPLYFPMSFSLVRPYVLGFEMNSLDALVLSNVAIDNNWRPKDGTRNPN